jgi:hypothetical protein
LGFLTLVSEPPCVVGGVNISRAWVGARLDLLQKYMVGNGDVITLSFEWFQLLPLSRSPGIVAIVPFFLFVNILAFAILQ